MTVDCQHINLALLLLAALNLILMTMVPIQLPDAGPDMPAIAFVVKPLNAPSTSACSFTEVVIALPPECVHDIREACRCSDRLNCSGLDWAPLCCVAMLSVMDQFRNCHLIQIQLRWMSDPCAAGQLTAPIVPAHGAA
jgi:hypothetical protein